MKHVFISPHIDDAMLSMGGLIIKLMSENRTVDILYIFTITDWVNPEIGPGKKYVKETTMISNIRNILSAQR